MKELTRNNVITKNEYLSVNSTKALKGYFAICILFHHLYQHTFDGNVTTFGCIMQYLGFLSVAMFFFFSGYGLQTSYEKKGDKYIESFFVTKIVPFYCIYVLLSIFYFIVNILITKKLDFVLLLKSFCFMENVISKGWYLPIIIYFYVAFFLIYKYVKKNKLLVFMLFTVLFCIFHKSSLHYQSIFAFVLGMFWSKYKDKIDNVLEKHLYIALLFSAVLFFGCFYLFILTKFLIIKMIAAVLFATLVIITVFLISKIENRIIANKLSCFIGKISLEIYVVHGLFVNIFHSEIINIENNLLYIILVLICTFILANIFAPIFNGIYKVFRKKYN